MVVLETQRLILRQYEDEDIAPLYHIFSDPETTD
jgi:[ribosomal protein S5]-alanine N-acetyltransferase